MRAVSRDAQLRSAALAASAQPETQGYFGRKTAKAEMGAVRAIPRATTNPGEYRK